MPKRLAQDPNDFRLVLERDGLLSPRVAEAYCASWTEEEVADNDVRLVGFRYAVSHPRGGGRVEVGVLKWAC